MFPILLLRLSLLKEDDTESLTLKKKKSTFAFQAFMTVT